MAKKLEVKDISFRYKSSDEYLLRDINLCIEEGELVGIIGLSGSGKTTFVNILNGLIPHRIGGQLEGNVLLDGEGIKDKEFSEISTMIGTVFQDPDTQLFFSCVEDEIAFGLENLCVEPDEIRRRIDSVTKLLGIEHLLSRDPNTLSGGEKQLVVVASVISMDVQVLILDECMSQVDLAGKQLILSAIKALKDQGKTIVMVEHDMDNLVLADKVYEIANGKLLPQEGRVRWII